MRAPAGGLQAAGAALGVGILVSAAAFAAAFAHPPGAAPGGAAASPLRVLDVPFLPQKGPLCGGAALAMVLRYWGDAGARAEDFAPLLAEDGEGIRTGDLVEAVRRIGWRAHAFRSSAGAAAGELARGRPLIVLLREGRDRHHYVVLVAWTEGHVLLHDPARGPFRTATRARFDEAWSGAGNWALLVLPPAGVREEATGAPDDASSASGASGAPPPDSLAHLVEPSGSDPGSALAGAGARLARAGDLAGAGAVLDLAQARWPDSPAVIREQAGIRFQERRWSEASRLAARAASFDPADAYTWRLLGASRFLAGDRSGALAAWNRIGEPRIDLVRVEGLARTRYAVVAGLLDLEPGAMLSDRMLRRARRRLAAIPAAASSRLSYRTLPGGAAQVEAAVQERPRFLAGSRGIWSTAMHAVGERELLLGLAGQTGNGELWTASWRFWDGRPRAAVGLAAPGPWASVWRVEGIWERQSFRLPAPAGDATGAVAAGAVATEAVATEVVATEVVATEERRRASLAMSRWATADLLAETVAALDDWQGRGSHLALGGALEIRFAGDRLGLRGEGARAWRFAGGTGLASGGVTAHWRSTALDDPRRRPLGLLRAGMLAASAGAPMTLWPAAGVGPGGPPLLRAHPLVEDGVTAGKGLGRRLAHAGCELQVWPWSVAGLGIGFGGFIDAARPWATVADGGGRPDADGRGLWLADAGGGLRLRPPGRGGLRLDAAWGLLDRAFAVSLAVETSGWRGR